MHVGIVYPRLRGKRSRHSRRIRTRNFTYLARGPWRKSWTYRGRVTHLYTSPSLVQMMACRVTYGDLSRPQCVESWKCKKNKTNNNETVNIWNALGDSNHFVNALRPFCRRHFQMHFLSIKSSLKFIPKVPIDNKPALIHIMAWRRPGDKPLSEPMMA